MLVATVLGSGLAALDGTVVGIALPVIGHDFRADTAALQLIVTGYLLTLAALLLLGGALADRFGRRRVFVVGVVWFALASAACGLATSTDLLVTARAVQGIGAALLTPGSLAIIEASFAPDDRGRAIGAWSGWGGVATAVGPLLGGYLISAVSWRLVFFINLPVAVAVVLIASRHVPESTDPSGGGIDLLGGALATIGLAGITYGIVASGRDGWTAPVAIVPLVGGGIGLGLFLAREATAAKPMLPMSLFAERRFSATNAVTLVVYGALGGALFLLPVELEQVVHYSPLAAGTSLLPVTVIMLALSARSGALAGRIGPRPQMSVGPVLVGAGLALLAGIGPGSSYLTGVLPGVVVFGLGLAVTVAPLTATVMAAAPSAHSGVASAVNNGVARTAGLLAVAVLPVAAGLTGGAYRHPVVFNAGFHRAVLYAAGACAIGGLVSLAALGPPRRAARPEPPPARHCGLDAPPLRLAAAAAPPTGATGASVG
ncbi:MAG TPA: DHA2 family efflux MFS transporter permease subunit [Acidimicrobiales bacterium]|nr:DHA2 family efflux MFS transporter permease subunit [Acidimicrobiales bacterium]